MFKSSFRHLRTQLTVSILAVVFLLTAAVLVVVRARVREHIREDLVSTLRAESAVYTDFVRLRREQTHQSAVMIADQPSLKALMLTNSPSPVQDGSESILESSGADLLILEGASGEILASHSRADSTGDGAAEGLLQVSPGMQDWWFVRGHLYEVSFAPIVGGSGTEQHLLGRIALGRDVSRQSVLHTEAFAGSAYVIERHGTIWLSSLNPNAARDFEASLAGETWTPDSIRDVELGGERYLANLVELPGDHPVHLYCLESFDQATRFLGSLNWALAIIGGFAVLAGALLAFVASRHITRPLEQLALGTQRLKQGDFDFQFAVEGSDEVAELTRAFDEMRNSLQRSRESLLRSARLEAVGQLAGGVAHDFNNLVMIIKGYSDLLLDSATPEARGHLEQIKNAGDRATSLTRQLLAFSRQQVLEPQVLDPNQTVRNMVKMLRVLIGEDIELRTNFSEQIGRVQVDPGQLEQVVMNLVVNARDAMPKGGKLIIETQPCDLDEQYARTHGEVTPGSFAMLMITDTGCGMSKETSEHIFEPFFTTKADGKGTGLGLATVYGIIKQSHGHISVDSEIGRGTSFKVYLPCVDQNVSVATLPQASAPLQGEGTILVVEDEPALCSLTAGALKKLGYSVLSAGNGVEALLAAEQYSGRIEILVTDVVMPRMGGPELVEKLRQKRDGFGVIFISGHVDPIAVENASMTSEASFLNKPFSAEQLARKVSEIRQRMDRNGKAHAAGNSA